MQDDSSTPPPATATRASKQENEVKRKRAARALARANGTIEVRFNIGPDEVGNLAAALHAAGLMHLVGKRKAFSALRPTIVAAEKKVDIAAISPADPTTGAVEPTPASERLASSDCLDASAEVRNEATEKSGTPDASTSEIQNDAAMENEVPDASIQFIKKSDAAVSKQGAEQLKLF